MNSKQILFLISSSLFLTNCNNSNSKNINSKKTEVTDTIHNSRIERLNIRKKIVDSVNISLEWEKTQYDLWKSKNGDLAIKTQEGIELGILMDRYISELCCEGDEIKNTVDTLTFKYLGSSFYKDKNHVYTHFSMADGGNFWIVEEADVKTFQVIGNTCYAKDKNYIYGERAMKMDSIDYKSFKTCNECGCYAKDKNGFYFWDSKIDLKDIEGPDAEKIKKELKKI